MDGVESGSEYSSSEHSYDEEIASSAAPSRSASVEFGERRGREDVVGEFDGCSERVMRLLRTRDMYADPEKRLLGIWDELYGKGK